MITYSMKTTKDSELKVIDNPKKGAWINIVSPTKSEVKRISEELNVSMDFLLPALDDDEKPRVEKEGENILFIVKIPVAGSRENEPYAVTLPLGIIFTKDNIITVCLRKNYIIDQFLEGNFVKNFYTTKKTRFLLQILRRSSLRYTHYLDMIEKKISALEDELLKTTKNKEIFDMMKIEKMLIYFNTAILSNAKVIERILKGSIVKLYKEDSDLLDDIIIDNTQTMDMVKIFTDVANNTMNAYASIINNNLNSVLKFLASFTIILSFPTIVASIYGMNVNLPFQNEPIAFPLVLLFALLVSSSVAMIFLKKKWF